MHEKRLVGEAAAELVENKMVVGLGSGSTVFYTLKKLGYLIEKGLQIQGVATSNTTAELAREFKIPLVDLGRVEHIDIAIDGADEMDPNFNLIKGGGGALLREKMVAKAAKRMVIIADSSKNVKKLGEFLLPVEVIPFGWEMTARHIQRLGGIFKLRMTSDNKPYVTDNKNYILDCDFNFITNPTQLEVSLNMLPGVVENGLFVNVPTDVITILNEEVKVFENIKHIKRTL
ncbi:ribose-5-phosphate isomerase RpiA [Priestia megaterium]|uniref:ribose-5-phosphate isomerase RpiA n=1 Tax=Priestia megaterium TaxID=1404 RepID=UPI002E1CE3E1|nr:ribose-5-phosphate isomerase RpiA [Priestia megaterium]MED4285244.1 ribose-5-phosphate isomerase RpiA [Priestia megaterium]